jgi:hypothetical protein
VFGSIMQVLDPDDGPTEADMRRMSAVHAELETFITEFTPMTDQQITAVRAYLRQWMDGAWTGPMVDVLRTQVEEIVDRLSLDRWLDRAAESNIDPL